MQDLSHLLIDITHKNVVPISQTPLQNWWWLISLECVGKSFLSYKIKYHVVLCQNTLGFYLSTYIWNWVCIYNKIKDFHFLHSRKIEIISIPFFLRKVQPNFLFYIVKNKWTSLALLVSNAIYSQSCEIQLNKHRCWILRKGINGIPN